MRFDQINQTTEGENTKSSQTCSMKSMGSSWENLIQLEWKRLYRNISNNKYLSQIQLK